MSKARKSPAPTPVRFAELLEAAPQSVRETAELAGVTVAMLYRYRDGARPRKRRLAQLAAALGCTVDALKEATQP